MLSAESRTLLPPLLNVVKSHLRTWYRIALSPVPPIWAATNWHQYTHVADGFAAVSYIALLASPALFLLGARRLFENLEPDASLELGLDADSEE